jgi:hypothetical protein
MVGPCIKQPFVFVPALCNTLRAVVFITHLRTQRVLVTLSTAKGTFCLLRDALFSRHSRYKKAVLCREVPLASFHLTTTIGLMHLAPLVDGTSPLCTLSCDCSHSHIITNHSYLRDPNHSPESLSPSTAYSLSSESDLLMSKASSSPRELKVGEDLIKHHEFYTEYGPVIIQV